MGQQQLLLIVLGVIIVGIAVVAGIGMFNAGAEEATKDELVSHSLALAAKAQQHYKKPEAMGGGANTYTGFTIPVSMSATENGTYEATTVTAAQVVITATPVETDYAWTVETTIVPAAGTDPGITAEINE